MIRCRPLLLPLLLALAWLAPRAAAQNRSMVTLQGVQKLGPIETQADGTFVFPGVPLRSNAVNRITVTAKRQDGAEISKQIAITQISLGQVVVSKITARPLSPQEIEQLVQDGTIKLDDPANFNVSKFDIVLTIGGRSVPVSVPVSSPKGEEFTGYEVYSVPSLGDGGGGGTPPDTEVIVFEQKIPATFEVPNPPSIPGVIIIEGRIKSLKEFFSVRLMLMNTSGIFTLSDLTAQIAFPDEGLSNVLPQSGMIAFGDIGPGDGDAPGQAEREFIIRGDKIGKRGVKVDFGGFLTGPGIPEEEPIPFNGSAQTEVEVKGPPAFRVEVIHPDFVVQDIPYDLIVKITNTGESPALYASLDLDVGGAGVFVENVPDGAGGFTVREIEGTLTRQLGHLQPGSTASLSYKIKPLLTGPITSCMGVSDQNVQLQVAVGTIGCLVGHYPPDRGDPDGLPTVNVLPFPDAIGIGVDSPVVAFFSAKMQLGSISLGEQGTFQVRDKTGEIVPGQIQFIELNNQTVAIWQVNDGITNRLTGNSVYTVAVTQAATDLQGHQLFSAWSSSFATTDPVNDQTAPQVQLSVDPPADPNLIIPGERVPVVAYASDQGSGVRRVELRIKQEGSTENPVLLDQKTVFPGDAGPFHFLLNSATLLPGGHYQLIATGFDNAGNIQDATLPLILAASADPPTIVLPPDKTTPTAQGISVPLAPVSVSAIAREVRYHLDGAADPFAVVSLAPWNISINTAPLAPGTHFVAAVAVDSLGREGGDFFQFEVVPNDAKPTVRFAPGLDGGVFPIAATLTVKGIIESTVELKTVSFYLDSIAAVPVHNGDDAFQLAAEELGVGTHTLYIIATNQIGNANDPLLPRSFASFEIVSETSGVPPSAPTINTVSPPDADGLTHVAGQSAARARIDLQNVTKVLTTSVNADASGAFQIAIDAAAGDQLRLTATDFHQSPNPSTAALATVPAAPVVVALLITPSPLSFTAAGQFFDLAVKGQLSGGDETDLTSVAAFSSLAPAIAGVSASGRVAPQANGSTQIKVAASGLTALVPVSVDIVHLVGLSVVPPSLSFTAIDEQVSLVVRGRYSDGTVGGSIPAPQFLSNNSTIATVTAAGLVQARANGITLIHISIPGFPPVQVPVSVDSGQAAVPVVEILSPAEGASFEPGGQIVVQVRGSDAAGTLSEIKLEASGAAAFVEARAITPVQSSATVQFSFNVKANASPGQTIALTATARNSSGKASAPLLHTLQVVDATPPIVTILAPAPLTNYRFNDQVQVRVGATDNFNVQKLRFSASGAFATEGEFIVDPAAPAAEHIFSFTIPFGLTRPDITLQATAIDASGNLGSSAIVPINVTDADTTPPETHATSASSPGAGATSNIAFTVADGLTDLDYVLLYFRRNGLGTFNRYTTAANPAGEFHPAAGANGTIAFDSTRQGGDGAYEFYTVGVDAAGNHEASAIVQNAVADVGGSFATGAAYVSITAPTVLSTNAFDNQNLRISGVAVTLVGAHVFHNVELLNGAALTHEESTETAAKNLFMECWTLTIDATSKIDATGRGHLGGKNFQSPGLTAGNSPGSTRGAGGSYGGLGGAYAPAGAIPNPVYGDLTNPLDLGSGGGAWDHQDGGDGGGLIQIQALNIVLDGKIAVNGALADSSAAGNGSGGGINIHTATLSGTGAVSADGGTKPTDLVNGGGGRIAIHHTDISTFDSSHLTARGGQSFYGTPGANGSVYLQSLSQPNGELVIEGQGPATPFTSLPIPAGRVFDSVTLRNFARVVTDDPIVVNGTLLLEGNSVLTHGTGNEAGLRITADSVIVRAGSSIDLTGRGLSGGKNFQQPGTAIGGIQGAARAAGGSYGGYGAGYLGAQANQVYGNPRQPALLGSGGGAWDNEDGGNGGGRLSLVVGDLLLVDGTILSNGARGQSSAAGGGSGGSVMITASRLSGAGRIAADGGAFGGDTVSGGGGRVALDVEFIDPNSAFAVATPRGTQLKNVTAFAGRSFYDHEHAGAGTVYLKLASQQYGELLIDDNRVDAGGIANATAQRPTPLMPFGPGTALAATNQGLALDGRVAVLPGALVGLALNPDTRQTETFAILSNTADTVTVETPNAHGIAFGAVASAGAPYELDWRFDRLWIRNGGHLLTGDALHVNGAAVLQGFALLTQPDATLNWFPQLHVDADEIWIDSSSRIDVSGKGYLGGKNFQSAGQSDPGLPGAGRAAGGSYGGLGATYLGNSPNPLYGSIVDPVSPGSGGGAWDNQDGGDGGGVVRLVARLLHNDGKILSNGNRAESSAAGGGSGGSINATLATVEGTGILEASGGFLANDTVGGGGGRVAVRVSAAFAIADSQLRALGGRSFYADLGGQGTIFLKRPGQARGDLIIDGADQPVASDRTFIPGGLVFDNIDLRRNASLTADAGIEAVHAVRLAANSRITHSVENENGLVIKAATVEVDATSAIDATGRGYRGGFNFQAPGRTLGLLDGSVRATGGSHGGYGAGYQGRLSDQIYDNPYDPTRLGGGGGAWDNEDGGNGGGRVRVIASSRVTIDGRLAADGAAGGGSAAGNGAGGTIAVTAPLVGGEGEVSANGGANPGSQVSGGGGRIAVFAGQIDAAHNFNNLLRISAFAGRSFYDTLPASAGTVFIKTAGQAIGTLIIDDNRAGETAPRSTPLVPLGPGRLQAVGPDIATVEGAVALVPNGLVGLQLNPDLGQEETFLISGNTGNQITVVSPNSHGIALSGIAAAGDTYAIAWRFDELQLRRGGNLIAGDPIRVNGLLNLQQNALVTQADAALDYATVLDVIADTLTVDASSRFDVSAAGLLGGKNFQSTGHTIAGINPSARGAGGSYGGLGGGYQGAVPNPVYGSVVNPVHLGSGGGAWDNQDGGDGGGAILLAARVIHLDGKLIANGGLTGGSAAGMGSGGSVNILVDQFSGAGTVEASGPVFPNEAVAGGGGRVAVAVSGSMTFPQAGLSAAGGRGFYGTQGSAGTVSVVQLGGDAPNEPHTGSDAVAGDDALTASFETFSKGFRRFESMEDFAAFARVRRQQAIDEVRSPLLLPIESSAQAWTLYQ